MHHASRMIRSSVRKPALLVMRRARVGMGWNSAACETGVAAIRSGLSEIEGGGAMDKIPKSGSPGCGDRSRAPNTAYGFVALTAARKARQAIIKHDSIICASSTTKNVQEPCWAASLMTPADAYALKLAVAQNNRCCNTRQHSAVIRPAVCFTERAPM